MEPITLKVKFKNIGAVSDRTARSLLKDISKLCRRAQRAELEELMEFLDLSRRERQSIRDRISDRLADGPAYYLKDVRTGSIEVALVCSALAAWLLQNTLGETVKESWRQTKIHKGIVNWVSKERPSKLFSIMKRETGKYDFLSGRALATEIEESKKNKIIEVNLDKADDVEIEQSDPIVDDEILAQSRIYLSRLDQS